MIVEEKEKASYKLLAQFIRCSFHGYFISHNSHTFLYHIHGQNATTNKHKIHGKNVVERGNHVKNRQSEI